MRKPRASDVICDALKTKLVVSYLPLAAVTPSERNARTHSQEQIKQLVASIGEFGWTNPILIDEDRAIIAGHGRLEAARAAGLADVPTIMLTGLSADQKRALAIADNKLALNAGWDDDLLRLELSELGLEGFDLSLIGFSKMELDQILAPDIDPRDEWRGMPEFEQGNMDSFRSLVVHFPDQQAVDAFAQAIAQDFTSKARFIWYPKQQRQDVADQRYMANEPALSDLYPL